MKTAIVLSGGGSKGSYQLGVWKALRRLHIKYDIVTGTSIGAINGALMTEDSYYKARIIWERLDLEYLFNKIPKSYKNIDVLKLFSHEFLKNNGMEIQKIESILKKNININKFYRSNINFGLVTYNITTKKPLILSKDKIKKEKLIDYLMASATCYPAFKMKEIDGDKYIDGGVYDNLPATLALKLGATNLIIVDLNAPGIKKKIPKEVPKIIIKPHNKISFFLNFNKEGCERNIKFGYNDTLKAFKKLMGYKYSFKPKGLKKYYQKNKHELNDKTLSSFIKSLEDLGKIFTIDESNIYSFNDYIKLLRKKIKNESKKRITLNIKSSSKIAILYFLKNINKKKKDKFTYIFPKEYKLALYLSKFGVVYEK